MKFQIVLRRILFTLLTVAILGAGYFIYTKVAANNLETEKKAIIGGIIAGRSLINSGQFTYSIGDSSNNENVCFFEDGKCRYEEKSSLVRAPRLEDLQSGKYKPGGVRTSKQITVRTEGETMSIVLDENSNILEAHLTNYDPEIYYHLNFRANLHLLKHNLNRYPVDLVLKDEIKSLKGHKITSIGNEELNGIKCKRIRIQSRKKDDGEEVYSDIWIAPEQDYSVIRVEEIFSKDRKSVYTAEFEKVEGVWILKKYNYAVGMLTLGVFRPQKTESSVLSNWKINEDIPDDLFKLEFPKGTLVNVHPIGAKPYTMTY